MVQHAVVARQRSPEQKALAATGFVTAKTVMGVGLLKMGKQLCISKGPKAGCIISHGISSTGNVILMWRQ